MYTLGIPKRDYRRATQVLGYESQPQIPFEADLKDDGFYIFSFPEADEFDINEDEDFEEVLGPLGFPEDELFGQEDIFLHKKILESGKRNKKVDVNYYHFNGISTFLLFSNTDA